MCNSSSVYPPVIIIGMHRSGTTMLARLLDELCIFLGAEKETNNEAVFFLKQNVWILKQANATWDDPYHYDEFSLDRKERSIAKLKERLESPKSIHFLGKKKFRKYKGIHNIDIPWGWKDPRNTITADIWAKIFPKAKFIHIYRNPIDVAESLRIRETMKYKTIHKKGLGSLLALNFKKEHLSTAAMDINYGISLWEYYTTRALRLDECLANRILHIKYEDFIEKPKAITGLIFNFLKLEIDSNRLQSKLNIIRRDRKYAFLNEKGLYALYEAQKDSELMKKLNYDRIV